MLFCFLFLYRALDALPCCSISSASIKASFDMPIHQTCDFDLRRNVYEMTFDVIQISQGYPENINADSYH